MVAIGDVKSRREELVAAIHRSRADELEELHRAHRPERHRSLVAGWLGGWLRRTARVERPTLANVEDGELAITFGGHATILARYRALSVVCDPMLGRRLGMVPRAVEPGLMPADLRDVELVLLSSPEPDHLHRPTLARLPRRATIVVPSRCADLVCDLGFARVVELGAGSSLSLHGVDVTAIPVRHPVGARHASAYVLRGDGPSLFFCGESGYFSGFAEIGKRERPDIAALPIGGYVPRSFRSARMSPLDALYAFEDLGARMLVPIRHGAFLLSYERLDEPAAWLARLVHERGLDPYVTSLTPGGSSMFRLPRRKPAVESRPSSEAPAEAAAEPTGLRVSTQG